MLKQEKQSPLGLYTIGVAALFLAGFFLLVVFGAGSYRDTVRSQTANNQTRALLSYFETSISSADHRGQVYTEDSEYGQILVIPDGETGYGLRIYQYENMLMDEYAKLNHPVDYSQGSPIAPTSLFRADWKEEGLLQITTDAGSILIRLRSGERGAGS